MRTCDDGHEEICFDERMPHSFSRKGCPLCDQIKAHSEANEINKKRIEELNEVIDLLKQELASIRDPLVAAVKIANEERTDHEK